jgi:arylformamidase
MVEEARAAVAWLRREAEALGIDCTRVGVCGHSAGGHLTAMTMLAAWPDMGLPAPRVFCPVSGVFDLEPIRLCYLNRVLGLDAAMAAATSPQRLIEAGTSLPRTRLILAVGGRETAEFRRQQADFAAACAARGLAPQIVAQDEDHHFSIVDRLAEPQSRLHQALAAALTQS